MAADQLLVNVIENVVLAAGASTTIPHGLKVRKKGVVPTQVLSDRVSTIAVTGVDTLGITFTNVGPSLATASFRAEYDHSIHADGALPIAYRGWDGIAIPAGPASGDLAGTYPAPTVVGIQGAPVDGAPPVANDYLRFDGSVWRHTLVAPGSQVAVHGCFADTTDQPLTAGVPAVVRFNTTETANGVNVANDPITGFPTRLTVTEDGVYAVNISPQIQHTGGGTTTITFWLKLDGVNVPRSASSLEMGNNNNRTIPFFETTLELDAGQYIEWAFLSTGTNTSLEHFAAAGAVPEIPSVIASVKRLGSKP